MDWHHTAPVEGSDQVVCFLSHFHVPQTTNYCFAHGTTALTNLKKLHKGQPSTGHSTCTRLGRGFHTRQAGVVRADDCLKNLVKTGVAPPQV
ncbi:MAG: hypothetical protein EOO38_27215 [Cytophagaceae bacterium]|nr:MAG: hypothetical protein EOO38_27215 [Cytophagaceae bacterium]